MKKLLPVLMLTTWFATPSFATTTDEQNKQILKDAIVGAITGAVATEATKDGSKAMAHAQAAPEVSADKEGHKHWWKGNKNFSLNLSSLGCRRKGGLGLPSPEDTGPTGGGLKRVLTLSASKCYICVR